MAILLNLVKYYVGICLRSVAFVFGKTVLSKERHVSIVTHYFFAAAFISLGKVFEAGKTFRRTLLPCS